MKNTFKLAAIAVSMVLAAGLVACSSGDDVVDATTPEYLLTAKIAQYVDAIKYDHNVSTADTKKIKNANKEVMDIIGGCDDCLAYYFKDVKGQIEKLTSFANGLLSDDIDVAVEYLKTLKTKFKKEADYHLVYVYKVAVVTALDEVTKPESKVKLIEVATTGDDKGKLTSLQADEMNAYIDAVKALEGALTKTDTDYKTACKAEVTAADDAIKAFNELAEGTVTDAEIKKVTDKVDALKTAVNTKVVDKIKDPMSEGTTTTE